MASPTHRRSARRRRTALMSAAAVVAAGLGAVPFVMNASAAPDLAHQTLPAKDGWAAEGSGTTGGSKADAAHTHTVSTRAELVKALGSGSDTTPKIIQIKGTIDANGGSSCADYAAGTGYSLAAYLKAYDPAVWGRSKLPSGPQETARAAAKNKQAKNVVLRVPSNTTLVGVPGTGAGIKGGSVSVQGADNVIIRNLTFSATEDCFPQWDPTDGSQGEWNSAYDSITLRGATHVWADHNTFTDAPTYDSASRTYFGRKYQVHDGALDITNGSDLVTVERNQFTSHDKTMLIGSSDTDSTGKLRVTLHHNVWKGITQRAPLARIGQIHLYNNHYDTTKLNGYAHGYSINARARAQVVAEHNAWTMSGERKTSQLLSGDGTGSVAGGGNHVNGAVTDLVAAYNAANSKKLRTTVNWTPVNTAGLQTSAKNLPAELAGTTGAGVLTVSGTTAAAPTAVPTAAPTTAPATAKPAATGSGATLTVGASGTYRTVQSAIDAAAPGDTLSLAKGTYREVVNVPAAKKGLTIKGATGNAEDVVITYDNAAGTKKPDGTTYGTAGSATATFSANDLTVTGVTIQNTFDRSAHPEITQTQAVAVNAQGDRQVFTNDRFIGRQDTVLNWAPKATGQYRQYFAHSYIAGDVDFVFGNATAVYHKVNINLRDRGAAAGGLNGFLAAPNTNAAKPYGILITDSTIRSSAKDNTFYLGRPWHPSSDAVGQFVIRNTVLPAAVKKAGPWTDMSGFSWKSARFAEYGNTGPGAGVNANRPQLSEAQAPKYTAARYLAGTDGWNPIR